MGKLLRRTMSQVAHAGRCGRRGGWLSVSAGFTGRPLRFSLACDMKGRDPLHLSRCFEQCINMNSRQGMHVTVSAYNTCFISNILSVLRKRNVLSQMSHHVFICMLQNSLVSIRQAGNIGGYVVGGWVSQMTPNQPTFLGKYLPGSTLQPDHRYFYSNVGRQGTYGRQVPTMGKV